MPKKELITVALVEEELFLRTTLAELIGHTGGYRVVLCTSWAAFAAEAEAIAAPRITLVGVGPEPEALVRAGGVLAGVKERWAGTHLLAITCACGRDLLTRTIVAGVRGYILRGTHSVRDLMQALVDLTTQGHSIPAEVVFEIAQLNAPSADDRSEESLSRMEKKVLDAVCAPDDPSWKTVAERLIKGVKTVGTHTAGLFAKLGFHDKATLKAWGRTRGYGAGRW